ncbi:unnamed protein product [Prunus armeniaca]
MSDIAPTPQNDQFEPSQFEEPVDQQEEQIAAQQENSLKPMSLRRSDTTRRSTTISDYVYIQKVDFDIGDEADPTSFKEGMKSQNTDKWREAMLNELESMKNNQVWELVEPHKS